MTWKAIGAGANKYKTVSLTASPCASEQYPVL